MSLLTSIKGWFVSQAAHRTYKEIDPSHTDRPAGFALEPGKGYFRLWLSQMFLKHDRVLFQKQGPTVHSLVSFQFGASLGSTNPTVEIPNVAGPLKLKADNNDLTNVIQLNYAMTSLMPYNGGTIEIAAGLFPLKGDNLAKQFLGIMEEFSSLLAVPQMSAALSIAGPLANGVQALANLGNDGIELGLHQTFGGGKALVPGYLAIVRAPEGAVQPERLWVQQDQLRKGKDLASSVPYTEESYMLFRVEVRADRDDWEFLSSIRDPFEKAKNALLDPTKASEADGFVRAAIIAAHTSSDLARADRTRVAKAIHDDFEQFKKDIGLGAAPGTGLPSLSEVVNRVTPDEAKNVSLDELLTLS